MDRITPARLTREQLATFLRSPDLIRAFEKYINALAETVPDELAELQWQQAATLASQNALAGELTRDRDEADTRIQDLALQVAQLRERLKEAEDDSDLSALVVRVSQLAEKMAAGGYGMKRKRVVAGQIGINSPSYSNTFTISPPLASLQAADLFHLGSEASGTAAVSDAAVRLTLTDVSTVTASRTTNGQNVIVSFRLTEYEQ